MRGKWLEGIDIDVEVEAEEEAVGEVEGGVKGEDDIDGI